MHYWANESRLCYLVLTIRLLMEHEMPSFHPWIEQQLWHFHPRSKRVTHYWANESQLCYLVLTSRLLMEHRLWHVTRDLIANQRVKILIMLGNVGRVWGAIHAYTRLESRLPYLQQDGRWLNIAIFLVQMREFCWLGIWHAWYIHKSNQQYIAVIYGNVIYVKPAVMDMVTSHWTWW
jgi:hypothetical protein